MRGGASHLPRTVLGAAIAGLTTCAFGGYAHWSVRSGAASPSTTETLLALVAIGAISGLVSGRLRDAPASWAGALVGWVVASVAIYTIDPGWPRGEDQPALAILVIALAILPFVVAGHFLGAAVGSRLMPRPSATPDRRRSGKGQAG